jgi:hypothetical protein
MYSVTGSPLSSNGGCQAIKTEVDVTSFVTRLLGGPGGGTRPLGGPGGPGGPRAAGGPGGPGGPRGGGLVC